MCCLSDYLPVKDSSGTGSRVLWLGIEKLSTWKHSGQPLNFTNWRGDSGSANTDQASTVWQYEWKWNALFMPSDKAAFICERDI